MAGAPARIVSTAHAGLGFRDDDAAELAAAMTVVQASAEGQDAVTRIAEQLRRRIGRLDPPADEPDYWAGLSVDAAGVGTGVLPMLALLATAPDVAAFHTARGVPAEVSTDTLAELGQQVWVHRLTYGEFGLHTYGWLGLTWSGRLYRLGRLQFNLERAADGWVLDTHIPRSGPLDPDGVEASIGAAGEFFARHFPECPVVDIVCRSWLLDPTLAGRLPDSNLAAFQRRWTVYGEPQPGVDDALFFVFGRRGAVDLTNLLTDTALRRVVKERLASGAGWSTVSGRLRG